MHGFDVDAGIRSDVPDGTNRCGQISIIDRHERSMVDVNRFRSRRGKFATIESGGDPRNDRPCVCVGSSFTGEVSRVEFFEGGVDVVWVNHDVRRDPIVGVDLRDEEHFDVEFLIWAQELRTTQREAVPTDRDDGRWRPRRCVRGRNFTDRFHVRDFGIATMSGPGVHHAAAIVGGNIVGEHLGHGGPVACHVVRPKSLERLACRICQRRPTQLVESRKRDVEVCLVEELPMFESLAFDRDDHNHPPLNGGALYRDRLRRVGRDRPETAESMHRLDAESRVWRESQKARMAADRSSAANVGMVRWSTHIQSAVTAGISCRFIDAMALLMTDHTCA